MKARRRIFRNLHIKQAQSGNKWNYSMVISMISLLISLFTAYRYDRQMSEQLSIMKEQMSIQDDERYPKFTFTIGEEEGTYYLSNEGGLAKDLQVEFIHVLHVQTAQFRINHQLKTHSNENLETDSEIMVLQEADFFQNEALEKFYKDKIIADGFTITMDPYISKHFRLSYLDYQNHSQSLYYDMRYDGIRYDAYNGQYLNTEYQNCVYGGSTIPDIYITTSVSWPYGIDEDRVQGLFQSFYDTDMTLYKVRVNNPLRGQARNCKEFLDDVY